MKVLKFIKELNKPYKVRVSSIHFSEVVLGKAEDVYVTTTKLEETKEYMLDTVDSIKGLIIACVMYFPIVAAYMGVGLSVYMLFKLAFMI